MNNFQIYKASAGSGKTYTLVKEYLKLVLNEPDEMKATLAITFTNKAAEEMKTRIISKLKEIADGSDDEYLRELEKEGVKGDIRKKARFLLEEILHKYSDFSVMTIDSFFHRIIRSFSRELRLQFGYNIEINEDAVMDNVVDSLIDDAVNHEQIIKLLEEFTFYNMESEKGWRIENKIKDLAKELQKERFWEQKLIPGLDVKLNSVIKLLFMIIEDYESEMTKYSKEISDMIYSYGLSVEDFPHKSSGYINWFLNSITDIPKERVISAMVNIKQCIAKKSSERMKQCLEEGLYNLMRKAYDYFQTQGRKYFTAKEILKTVYMLGVFGALINKMREWRDDNRMMLISDANILLKGILSNETVPFVYERTGSRYRNFLIDEFQDTSTFQWNNLLPLILNALSEGTKSMVVGDVKQSIYRWRNGNVRLLLYQIREDLKTHEETIKETDIEGNRRSLKNIVEFNNLFFSNAADIFSQDLKLPTEYVSIISDAYKNVRQDMRFCEEGGYVKMIFTEDDKDKGKTSYDFAGEKLLEFVTEALNDGYKRSDIMILVRTRKDGNLAADLLIERGHRVVSADSLLLTSSPAVKLILNLFKLISDSTNRLAKTEVLYNYLIISGKDESEVYTSFSKNTDNIFESYMPEGFIHSGIINSRFYTYGLYELTENLISVFGLNKNTDAYLLRFLDVIHEYSAKYNADIISFINWWEEHNNRYTVTLPEDEDAIRIMTIHKAKGLESPVVVIPYCSWRWGNGEVIWTSLEEEPFNELGSFFVRPNKNLSLSLLEKYYFTEKTLGRLDNLNLLYVAFTRARERLYVIAPKGEITGRVRDSLSSSFPTDLKEGVFEYGKRIKKEVSYKRSDKRDIRNGFISGDFYNRIVIKPSHYGYDIKSEKEKISRGDLLHRILCRVKFKSDITKVIELSLIHI
ncbi:MAG: UvrD-helicase domain-containing protein, partial [Ignavibacteria bacterium]|nr:UvrD-helicase domain-containing protein [Ignavibacteria bacterium]